MDQELNPYRNIFFQTATETFSVVIGSKMIGNLDTLKAAISARDAYIEYHAHKRAFWQPAAYPQYETRAHA